MKVLVLGSGVIGVASACCLAKAGLEVIVVDRRPSAGMETSFANAGEISPGYASPWASPGIPFKALRWMLMRHPPLLVRPGLDARAISWLWMMLRKCTQERYAINKERMVRLAGYSRDCLIQLRSDIQISYDGGTGGTLQLFRSQRDFDACARDVAILQRSGISFELLDGDACVAAEPGLVASRDKINGGLRLPLDETGDCYLFTKALAREAEKLGVEFRYDTEISALTAEGAAITAVKTGSGDIVADRYVVAMASYSPALLRPLKVALPIYPVKGYSITVPIADECAAPMSTIMDETYKIAITRLGNRIRVGGMAEIAGFNDRLSARRRAALVHSLTDLFPAAGLIERSTFWSGLRPMTPDGSPVIGPTPYRNLFLNTGHGTLGWTMACGSGQLIADIIAGRETAIAAADLSMHRYES